MAHSKKLLFILFILFATTCNAQVVQRQAQFIDRFNRSNSSTDLGYSAAYTGSNGLAVYSNHVIDSAADLTNNYTRLDAPVSYTDFIAEWDVYMVGSGFIGFVARATYATASFYMFGTDLGTGGSDDNDTYWVKVELGSATGFAGSGDLSSSTVYHIKAVMQGTSIKIYTDGVLMVDTTDSDIASGADSMYIWFNHNSTSSYIDNLQVTSLD